MMGAQAIADEAGTLLSIIADNDKYKAKIKEMKELAQALTAEKDRLAEAQRAYNEQVKQVSDDRTAIEKASAKAQADLKEAQAARDEAIASVNEAKKVAGATQAQIGSTGAANASRTAALDKLTAQIEAREAKLADKEKAVATREAALKRAEDDLALKMARLKEAVG
jgi:colicin import membrane protein